ncbi:MAG TPA: hypothetical protein VFC56_03655 [Stellaceae bacterium]|nr:hypothetical protein [Stellaceae bacterium]
MAKTALTQLQDQIEAVRREAYAAGYAAAMQAIRDFAAHPAAAPSAPGTRRGPNPATPAEPTTQRGRRAGRPATAKTAPRQRRRPQRGSNARLIAEVLKALPSGTGRPADIRKALQSDKGVAMAFTSIRHALGQLAARNEVEPLSDGKSWRYLDG